jgi:hypothetical protein
VSARQDERFISINNYVETGVDDRLINTNMLRMTAFHISKKFKQLYIVD